MVTSRAHDGWFLVENQPPSKRFRVLLLPGLLCTDVIYHDMLADDAMRDTGVHLTAGNPPGFKGQPAPAGFDFSVAAYASMIDAFIAAQQFDLVVGHSFFGNVLIEMLGTTTYTRKIMLLSPSLYRMAEPNDTRMLDSMSRKPVLSGLTWLATYLMLKSIFKPYFTVEKRDRLDEVVSDAKRTPRSVCRKLLMSLFAQIDTHRDLTGLLTATRLPVWYVRGQQDNIGFSNEARRALEACPMITIVDIPDSRHFAMLDKPREMNQLIREVLEKGR
jgi:pimeloyl-ACP methyl ester carboxylesterase